MDFKSNIHPTDIVSGGARFRLVLARAKPLLRVVVPAFFEGNMSDAWDNLAKSGYTINISPRPIATSQTAVIDVRIKMEKAGAAVSDVVTAIQRVLGVWTELVSIEPLDIKALAVTVAPSARAKAEAEAAAEGHGQDFGQQLGSTFQGALKAAKGLLLTVLVVGGIGLLLYAGITRARLRG